MILQMLPAGFLHVDPGVAVSVPVSQSPGISAQRSPGLTLGRAVGPSKGRGQQGGEPYPFSF